MLMGMRRNIALSYHDEKTPPIYLYTHWGADGLEDVLAKSLERGRARWDDESYLARIIFTDMTSNVKDDLTGYGIAPYEIDDEYPTLHVNFEDKTVNEVPYEDFIKNPQMFAI